MKRKDLRKRLDLKAYANLPKKHREWLADTAFIQDFNRTLRSMTSPLEGGACVMRHVRHSDRRDVFEGMYRDTPRYESLARLATQYITSGLTSVQDIRHERHSRNEVKLTVNAINAKHSAERAVRGAQGAKTPSKAQPVITCYVNRPPSVVATGEGGMANISINWIRSVEKEGIGVLDWNASDKVLVVSAKHNPSVFLAEMGVKCFEVKGMRLGIKAFEVNGYAFTVVLNGTRRSIFAEEFRRGVRVVENLIAEAFGQAMKVL